jgi:hypothetical protein
MDADRFRTSAELNQDLADYLDGVAQAADPEQAHRSAGLTLLFIPAAYALYRLAKNHFDHQRGLSEEELRQKMLDQVDTLVKGGLTHDKALAAVLKVSKDVATLREDSPILKAALELLKSSK